MLSTGARFRGRLMSALFAAAVMGFVGFALGSWWFGPDVGLGAGLVAALIFGIATAANS